MKIYQGEPTGEGCKVTVDAATLRMCSNLSGNVTTAFDWGYIGTGQLSLALPSAYCATMSPRCPCPSVGVGGGGEFAAPKVDHDRDLSAALAPIVGLNGVRAGAEEADGTAGAAFGDMPVWSGELLPLKAEDDGERAR